MALHDFHKGLIFMFSLIIIAFTFCTTVFADDTTPIVYTANMLDNTASIINMNDNSVVATIYGLDLPMGIAISPDYNKIYVTNSGSDSVAVINATTYQIIDTIPVGRMPYGIAVTPDGGSVYVANNEDNTVSLINTSSGKVTATISVGGAPYCVRANPVSGDIYVTNTNDGTISVIRGKGVIATIPVGKYPTNGLAVTPDGSLLFVANSDSNNVSAINMTTNTAMYSVNTGTGPTCVAISPDGWYAYVGNAGSRNISIMQISDKTIRVSLSAKNASMIAVSSDGKVLYVVTAPDGRITVMNSATGETEGAINVRPADMGAMLVNSSALVDTTPPITTLKLIGINDSNGNFIKEVTISLTAHDYPSGTEIDNIQYSLDGMTWMPYTGNITLKNARNIAVYYHAIDKAGNVEIIRSHSINIVDSAATPATPEPSALPSLTIPPKPTALPEDEIYTVTPAAASNTPQSTDGFEVLLAMVGLAGVGYMLVSKDD